MPNIRTKLTRGALRAVFSVSKCVRVVLLFIPLQLHAATLIDFNNLPLGSLPESFNAYNGEVNISATITTWDNHDSTRPPLTGPGSIASVTDLHSVGGPAVLAQNWIGILQYDPPVSTGQRVSIDVSFLTPVAEFSVDLWNVAYSIHFDYMGVGEFGVPFQVSNNLGPSLLWVPATAAAPAGGYLTGFRTWDADRVGGVAVAIDNLDYTTVPEPNTLGLVVLGIGSLFLGLRRFAGGARTTVSG